MRNEATIYLMSFTVLLLLTLNLVVGCALPKPNLPPTLPKHPPTQPPVVTENQTPQEAPPVNEVGNEGKWYPIATYSGQQSETIPQFRVYGTELRIVWTIDAENPETAALEVLILFSSNGSIWKTVTFKDADSGDTTYSIQPGDNRDFSIKVVARSLHYWTITLEDNAPAATSSPIKITYIHYKGTYYPPDPAKGICTERVEPDEYVVIKNLSESPVKIGGWVLKNISQPSPKFTFPDYTMEPGEIIRVYTDEYHLETGGFCFYYGYGDIWNNGQPNIAVLYDAYGNEVFRKSYAVSTENE